jgi:hypothetical protein
LSYSNYKTGVIGLSEVTCDLSARVIPYLWDFTARIDHISYGDDRFNEFYRINRNYVRLSFVGSGSIGRSSAQAFSLGVTSSLVMLEVTHQLLDLLATYFIRGFREVKYKKTELTKSKVYSSALVTDHPTPNLETTGNSIN